MPHHPQLKCVAADMTSFCGLLNKDAAHFRLEPYAFQGSLVSYAYRLLKICPMPERTLTDPNENAVHLGLLCFLTTMLFDKGKSHKEPYQLLASRLHKAITSIHIDGSGTRTSQLLWTLFIGAVSVFRAVDRLWLLPRIRSCLFALQITSWEDALREIIKLPWVHVVHDKSGCALWKVTMKDWDKSEVCLDPLGL